MIALVEVENLTKCFTQAPDLAECLAARIGAADPPAVVHAVDSVSLAVAEGEVVGLVGESGSGKSMIGRMIAGLIPPTEGTIRFRGADITRRSRAEAKAAALQIQMIFQDPMSSLNPRMRVQ